MDLLVALRIQIKIPKDKTYISEKGWMKHSGCIRLKDRTKKDMFYRRTVTILRDLKKQRKKERDR